MHEMFMRKQIKIHKKRELKVFKLKYMYNSSVNIKNAFYLLFFLVWFADKVYSTYVYV